MRPTYALIGLLAVVTSLGSLNAQNLAADLDGASWFRVSDSPSLDIAEAITIECWIRPNGFGFQRLVGKWGEPDDRSYATSIGRLQVPSDRYVFSLSPDGLGNPSFEQTEFGPFALEGWTHVACTFDGTTRRAYLNGELRKTENKPGPIHTGAIDLAIGARLLLNAGPVVDRFFNGTIDEVRIWSVARTEEQIRSLINETIRPSEVPHFPGLISVWNMDGDASDSVGLNDGQPVGNVQYTQADDIPVLFPAWEDLGNALGGTEGEPVLVGEGSLIPGTLVTLTLTDALPNAEYILLASAVNLSAPFKGGVLVPDPAPPGVVVVLPPLFPGFVAVSGTWPPGVPPGLTTYYQYWIVDPAGPAGFAASNAISGTAP